MENITEKMKVHEEWFKEARDMTMKRLPNFLKKLTEEYGHDYGTICHAITAAAIGAAWSVERTPQGGITGFQAGCIMWGFVRQWNYSHNKTGLKIVDYDDFLFPQYHNKLDKLISPDIWVAIQKEANLKIEDAKVKYVEYLKALEKYDVDIADFVKRYPDYYKRREYYDPLSIGNGEQLEAEEKKKAGGFEFAPQKPYEPINENGPVYQHWLSIVNGVVPFGYQVSSD